MKVYWQRYHERIPILKQLLEGKGQQAEMSIRNRFASWRRRLQTCDTEAPRRTVGELPIFPRPGRRLMNLSSVDQGAAMMDEACRILADIAEAYDLFATKKKFQQELKKFMAGHLRRKALIQRLVAHI